MPSVRGGHTYHETSTAVRALADTSAIIASAGMSPFRPKADIDGLKCGPAANDPKETFAIGGK